MNSKWSSRKFWGFIIALIALLLIGLLNEESVALHIVTLYGCFAAGNVAQKASQKIKESEPRENKE